MPSEKRANRTIPKGREKKGAGAQKNHIQKKKAVVEIG